MLYLIKGWISLILSIVAFFYTITYSKTMGYRLSPFIIKYQCDSGGFGALLFCAGLFFYAFYCFYAAFYYFRDTKPLYPVNRNNKSIRMPKTQIDELRELVKNEDRIKALITLRKLTGADLSSAIEFIDGLDNYK